MSVIKEGFMEIEYSAIITYYRRKYFMLKSNDFLCYFSSSNGTHKQLEGVIDLKQVISIKKCGQYMFEMKIDNHAEHGLFSPRTINWRFNCLLSDQRNDWFDCIQRLVSKNKKPVHAQRNGAEKPEEDDWCVVEEKRDSRDLAMSSPVAPQEISDHIDNSNAGDEEDASNHQNDEQEGVVHKEEEKDTFQ